MSGHKGGKSFLYVEQVSVNHQIALHAEQKGRLAKSSVEFSMSLHEVNKIES